MMFVSFDGFVDRLRRRTGAGRVSVSRFMIAASLLTLATACSATNYQRPVGDFSTATQNAQEALVALDQHVTQAYLEMLRSEVATNERLVRAKENECELTSERCRLVAVNAEGDLQLFPPEPLLGNMITLMRAVAVYAQGLADIVNADTAEQVSTHVNATLGSINNLANTIDALASTNAAESASAYKTSLGKAVNWFVGQYVATIKIDALRQATRQAQPVIERATRIFSDTTLLAADVSHIGPTTEFDDAREKYEATLRGDDLNILVARAAAYDRILVAKPSSVFEQLLLAHDALADHLQNKGQSFADVMGKIELFAIEAEAIITIVKEIQAVDAN